MSFIYLLIKNHANVNASDNNGETPIFYCSHKKHMDYLLKNGAEINILNNNKKGILRTTNKPTLNKYLIKNGAIPSTILIYKHYRDLFTKEQQDAFDSFLLLTNDDDQFFDMCLTYQNDQKNHVKIEIKDMDIL